MRVKSPAVFGRVTWEGPIINCALVGRADALDEAMVHARVRGLEIILGFLFVQLGQRIVVYEEIIGSRCATQTALLATTM